MKQSFNKIKLVAILACALFWHAQPVHGQCNLATLGAGACGGNGTSVTVNLGQTIANTADVDNGNALLPFANQFTTPTPSSGSITVTALGSFISSPAAANWGLAIYTDSSGAPGSLVSGCSTFSSATPATGANTLAPGTCNLSAATKYWIAFVTASNTQNQMLAGPFSTSTCPASGIGTSFVNSPIASFTSTASWPSTWPASTGGNTCHANYVTIQYSTAAKYTIVSSGVAECSVSTSSCTVDIVPTGSSHGMVVAANINTGTSESISSFSDSASDTITKRGTCPSNISSSMAMCLGSADQASSGVTTITASFSASNGGHGTLSYAEVQGTLSSSSFDQSHYDAATQGSPFTSGNTGTTGQANEILFGIAMGTAGDGAFTASGGWQLIGDYEISSTLEVGFFYQIVSSTGAYNLSGSYSGSSPAILPGLATFK